MSLLAARSKVKVGILRPVQQPGSYWVCFSALPVVGLEPEFFIFKPFVCIYHYNTKQIHTKQIFLTITQEQRDKNIFKTLYHL